MQKSNNFRSFRADANERLDQLLDILGGDENIESFSISKNKMIVEVSSLNDVEIERLHRTGSRRVDVCPAIIAFDLDDDLLNLIIKILVNNGNFEFNYSSIKNQLSKNQIQMDNEYYDRRGFEEIDGNNLDDNIYQEDEYSNQSLEEDDILSNNISNDIKQKKYINDNHQDLINEDFALKTLSIQEYIDYDKDNRILQWKKYSIINPEKILCNCCQESNRILVKLNNGANVCVNCWLKKPTEENVKKLINFNKNIYFEEDDINSNITSPDAKNKDSNFFVNLNKDVKNKPLSNIKTNLIKEDDKNKSISKIKTIGNKMSKDNLKSKTIIIKKVDRKWISRGIKEFQDN